jgi:hypothetical protein
MVAEKKILVINVWFGKWPVYLPYFLKTTRFNMGFTWLIVSNQPELSAIPANIQSQRISILEFNELATEKLGFPVNIIDPVKLCDFKPAFGKIFEDYLKDYDYWGYCDLDLITGNLGFFVNPLLEKGTDVISFYRDYLSGPLCLYRNSTLIKDLYKKVCDHEKILMDQEHYAMDENNKKRMAELTGLSKKGLRFQYLLGEIIRLNIFYRGFNETRYRYQWFLKKKLNPLHPHWDMTDVIFNQVNNRVLSVSFQDWIISDRAYRRAGRKKWEVVWKDGVLMDRHSKREVPVFHYIDLKTGMECEDVSPLEIPDIFTLDQDGFHHE